MRQPNDGASPTFAGETRWSVVNPVAFGSLHEPTPHNPPQHPASSPVASARAGINVFCIVFLLVFA